MSDFQENPPVLLSDTDIKKFKSSVRNLESCLVRFDTISSLKVNDTKKWYLLGQLQERLRQIYSDNSSLQFIIDRQVVHPVSPD